MTIPMPCENINFIRPTLKNILIFKSPANYSHPGSARRPLLTVSQYKDSQTTIKGGNNESHRNRTNNASSLELLEQYIVLVQRSLCIYLILPVVDQQS